MRANRQCSMCGRVTEVFVNPANTRIARCEVCILLRGYARTLIKKARRGFFGSVYYYAIIHGKRVERDDQEELVAWIVDQL